MKRLIISSLVFALPFSVIADELPETKKYFARDSNKQQFILSEDKICYGPDSDIRLTIPLSFGDKTIDNTFADLKACEAAGGTAAKVDSAAKAEPLLIGNCELNPKIKKDFTVSSGEEASAKELEYKKAKLTARIHCLSSKKEITEDDEKVRSALIVELGNLNDPNYGKEEQVSAGRIISSFELGTMKLPNYADGNNKGFSDTKLYFDSNIDGRFHFEKVGLLVNSTFNASFYGTGTYTKEEVDNDNGEDTSGDAQPSTTNSDDSSSPIDFNDVSDTLDASFTLRVAADDCHSDKNWFLSSLSCLSSSSDKKSSLGLTVSYGFINKEKRLVDEDTVNDYRSVGLEYRHYRKSIVGATNRIPDFIVSYQRAKFEEYGSEHYTEGCETENCVRPIEDVYRYVINLKYRLITDKPYFIGFRLNAGRGPDDYGLTLGIRKSGRDVLDIFGIK